MIDPIIRSLLLLLLSFFWARVMIRGELREKIERIDNPESEDWEVSEVLHMLILIISFVGGLTGLSYNLVGLLLGS